MVSQCRHSIKIKVQTGRHTRQGKHSTGHNQNTQMAANWRWKVENRETGLK